MLNWDCTTAAGHIATQKPVNEEFKHLRGLKFKFSCEKGENV